MATWVAPFACALSLIPVIGLSLTRTPGLEPADRAMRVYLQTFLHPASGGFITLCVLFAVQPTANSLLHMARGALGRVAGPAARASVRP